MVIDPLLAEHAVFVTVDVAEMPVPVVILTEIVFVMQPLASLTTTVWLPGARLLKV